MLSTLIAPESESRGWHDRAGYAELPVHAEYIVDGRRGDFRDLINSDQKGETIMLKDLEIIAVLPANDIVRARNFYRDVLGLDPADTMDEENLLYRCGKGTAFLLYQTDNAGTAKNTQMGWVTGDIDAEMQDLRSRGVVFEEYDFPGLKTENGIASTPAGKGAWFLDSEGNILNVSEGL